MKNYYKRNIAYQKTNCSFDFIAFLKINKQIFYLYNNNHNYTAILSSVYFTN